ncbi:MAG: hypothetical protein QXI11_03310 [Thermoproteota archaeon]
MVIARDIKNGYYNVNISWSYEDSNGSHIGGPITKMIYILPAVRLVDFGWEPTDFLDLFPKGEIKTTGERKFYFKIESMSSSTIYSGLYCKANFTINEPRLNMTITPISINVEPLGPQGKSKEYGFTVVARNAPPGTYGITVYLYSSEYLVTKHSLEVKVIPD